MNISGSSWEPFPFGPKINLKRAVTLLDTDRTDPAASQEALRLLLLILEKFYVVCYRLYQVFSRPDIDVNEFAAVIESSLREVKRQIPGCERAFAKIHESVELLKTNFGEYYKDFITTKNQTTIMENFILDVSKSTKPDPRLTMQFHKIIKFYRKQMALQKQTNPKLSGLMETIDKSMQQFGRQTANIKKMEADEAAGGAAAETAGDVAAESSGSEEGEEGEESEEYEEICADSEAETPSASQ